MAKKNEAKKVTGKGKVSAAALKDGEALKKTREAKALPEVGSKKEEVKGNKAKDQTPGAKAFYAGIDMSGVPEKTKAVALRGDVLPPETAGEALLKHPADEAQLKSIELCIERGLSTGKKLDVASTFTTVTVGCALRAAKAIIKPGLYEKWVETTFPNFSERQAQYYGKLSDVFFRETDARLALPPPNEMGTFLMRTDQDSGLFAEAIKTFVGGMTMAELLDKYRIKPKKAKGGHRPGSYMVKRYQDEHAHLQNKPFEVWSEKDLSEYKAWHELEVRSDNGAASIDAAESTWTTIRNTLTVQGINKKTFALLSKDAMSEISRVLGLVKGNVDDALKVKVNK